MRKEDTDKPEKKLHKKTETAPKQPKHKPKYGLFSCVGYIYKLLWHTDKTLVFTGIFTISVTVLMSALGLWTPSLILSTLQESGAFATVALIIVGLLLAKLIVGLLDNLLNQNIDAAEHYVLMKMIYLMNEKFRDRDYHMDFYPEIKKLDERAQRAINNNHTSGVHFPMDFAQMTARVLNFLLFGSVIATLSPLVLLLLIVGGFVDYMMGIWRKNKDYQEQDEQNAIFTKVRYCTMDIQEFKSAKDIRLYNMGDFLVQKLDKLFEEAFGLYRRRERRGILVSLVSFLVVLVRDGFAYGFLITKAVAGEIDAASFVLYFNAITSMAGFLGRILGSWGKIAEGAMQLSDFREAQELKDELNRGEGIPVPTRPFSIEFKNVSYKYPKGDKKVLDDVSFRIEPGEKIALVGLNGAGKTTLTLMMCGMLLPDEGEVLLDGHTLREYNRDELYRLFGIIPQEYSILPLSIARNIAAVGEDEAYDKEKVRRCIEVAGLSERVASLPLGADTLLNRELYKDGVDLSGGEKQKLLLARLLYKAPVCMILDEPTAALDALAEDRLYRKYNEIAEHATSIFISHRLASTRFCNRIFLLDEAKIAEAGSHEELMAAGGKYRELFDVQSKYYREGGEESAE